MINWKLHYKNDATLDFKHCNADIFSQYNQNT